MDEDFFSTGDWVVHIHHGVGQVRQKSTKRIGDHEGTYYRIELSNGTLWIPVDKVDHEALRPIASEEELQQAVDVLRRPPRQMASNFTKRKSRIHSVQSKHSLVSLARLVRDLMARRRDGSLSSTEESALRDLSERLLNEWAVCRSIKVDEAQQMLYGLLSEAYPDTIGVE